jgi:hypothetical protein
MLIRLKKVRDGVVLSCIREGGSAAVQRTGHAGFFALHDLMHYAVETTLGFRHAFFGLMAQGWDFTTFGDHDDPRYKAMPDEAVIAEHLVDITTRGIRDCVWTDPELLALWAGEVNAELATSLARAGRTPFCVEPARLAEVCRCFRDLVERWAAVPVGEHLELQFPPAPPAVQPRGTVNPCTGC